MLYKTMVLEILQQDQKLHDRLRRQRTLLPTLNHYAGQLRDRHIAWENQLHLARPASSARRIATEALELALTEIQAHLQAVSHANDDQPLTLDAAMAFLHSHTPPE